MQKAVKAAHQNARQGRGDAERHRPVFLQSIEFKSKLFGWDEGKNSIALMSVDHMPEQTKSAIKKAFASQGVANPTDGQILGVYLEGASRRPISASDRGLIIAALQAEGDKQPTDQQIQASFNLKYGIR